MAQKVLGTFPTGTSDYLEAWQRREESMRAAEERRKNQQAAENLSYTPTATAAPAPEPVQTPTTETAAQAYEPAAPTPTITFEPEQQQAAGSSQQAVEPPTPTPTIAYEPEQQPAATDWNRQANQAADTLGLRGNERINFISQMLNTQAAGSGQQAAGSPAGSGQQSANNAANDYLAAWQRREESMREAEARRAANQQPAEANGPAAPKGNGYADTSYLRENPGESYVPRTPYVNEDQYQKDLAAGLVDNSFSPEALAEMYGGTRGNGYVDTTYLRENPGASYTPPAPIVYSGAAQPAANGGWSDDLYDNPQDYFDDIVWIQMEREGKSRAEAEAYARNIVGQDLQYSEPDRGSISISELEGKQRGNKAAEKAEQDRRRAWFNDAYNRGLAEAISQGKEGQDAINYATNAANQAVAENLERREQKGRREVTTTTESGQGAESSQPLSYSGRPGAENALADIMNRSAGSGQPTAGPERKPTTSAGSAGSGQQAAGSSSGSSGGTGSNGTGGSSSGSSNVPSGSTYFRPSYGQDMTRGVKAPYRREGYSIEELEGFGNAPRTDFKYNNGKPAYEGYYLAPNGKYYPVDQQKAAYYRENGTYNGWNEGMREYYNTFGTYYGYRPGWKNNGTIRGGGYGGGYSYSPRSYGYSSGGNSTLTYTTQSPTYSYNGMKNWSF